MPAEWRIQHWPTCGKHVFLSHCEEDRSSLVLPVFEELQRRRIIGWIDRHHYPSAREAFFALQEELLKCRHVVYFITPAMLKQGRGWTGVERAYAAAIQQMLRYGEEIAHVELPLLFVGRDDVIFQRCAWRSLIDKAHACDLPAPRRRWFHYDGRRSWQHQHVRWAVDTIERFVEQEERWGADLLYRFGQDSRLSGAFQDHNLQERLFATAPQRLPGL